MRTPLRTLCFFGLVALLAGCGYQLQKPLAIAAEYQPVLVSGSPALATGLRRALRSEGIALTRNASDAASKMLVEDLDYDTHNLSVGSDGRNAERLQRISAQYSWTITRADAKTETLAGPIALQREVIQLLQPGNPAAQAQETELLREELRAALVQDMLMIVRLGEAAASGQ